MGSCRGRLNESIATFLVFFSDEFGAISAFFPILRFSFFTCKYALMPI